MKTYYQNRSWPFKSYHVKEYVFSPHLHNQIEVIYVLSGSCVIHIENISYDAVSGDLIILFPYQLHSISNSKDSELIVQVFEPEYATELIPFIDKYIPEVPLIKNMSRDCIDAIIKSEFYYLNNANSRIVRSFVTLYISFIYDNIKFIPSSASDYHSVLHSLLRYIDSHFTECLNLDYLARELHVTKYYISRIFNQKLHTTFTHYINQLRLGYAVNLLKNTNMSVSDIAYESGFGCERSFFRIFKVNLNVTPLYYRKNSQQIINYHN